MWELRLPGKLIEQFLVFHLRNSEWYIPWWEQGEESMGGLPGPAAKMDISAIHCGPAGPGLSLTEIHNLAVVDTGHCSELE